LQGERPLAKDNKSLARFILSDIPPAPRGVPQIEVTFDVDANGILHVSAKDLGTGKEQKITVMPSSGLTKEEIERMRREAEMYAEEDRKKREEIELRNEADALVYQSEKFLRENGDKLSADQRRQIEQRIQDVKKAMEGSDVTALRNTMEELKKAWHAASAELYRRAAAQGATSSGNSGATTGASSSGSGRSSDEVIDAEVIDDDKKKKS